MASSAKPTNGFKKSELKAFIDRVETVEDKIASETGEFMASVKGKRGDIKDILVEARESGIPMKALKAELKLRALDRNKAKVVAGLEQDDRDTLEAMQEALGDFASSPLGAAAIKQAEARL